MYDRLVPCWVSSICTERSREEALNAGFCTRRNRSFNRTCSCFGWWTKLNILWGPPLLPPSCFLINLRVPNIRNQKTRYRKSLVQFCNICMEPWLSELETNSILLVCSYFLVKTLTTKAIRVSNQYVFMNLIKMAT